MGTDPNLIEFISHRFHQLDEDGGGTLSILEITGEAVVLRYRFLGLKSAGLTNKKMNCESSTYRWKVRLCGWSNPCIEASRFASLGVEPSRKG